MPYKHILIATDLSEFSHEAAMRAVKLAKDAGAKLSMVHVMEHSPVAFGGEFSILIDPNTEQTLEATARKLMNQLGKKLHISLEDQHLQKGVVKTAVLNLVKKLHIDLIVVGTHSHHGLDKLLGSRANAILHHAPCDVLAVRANPS
jgi:universal stress protein A